MGVSVIKKTKSKLYEEKSAIEKLQELMIMLRDKKYGCPWDLEQTLTSLIPHTIEEVYEVGCDREKKFGRNVRRIRRFAFSSRFLCANSV